MKYGKLFATTRAKLTWVLVIVLLIALYFLIARQFTPYTNNAYVNADIVNISSSISGKVAQVYVHSNQLVRRGAPIFQVDKTGIVAPNEGYISNLQIHVGEYIRKGQPILPIIIAKSWWLQANFNENEIRNIHPGESAIVSFAMYPGRLFKAQVESISYGVRPQKSVEQPYEYYLPYIAPSNNWIKLPRQFPVQLRLMNMNERHPLRVGASANVTITPKGLWFWNGLAYFWSGLWSFANYLF